eukprot:6479713-Amphidinium_carterae.2
MPKLFIWVRPEIGVDEAAQAEQYRRWVVAECSVCPFHTGDHNVPNALMFIDKYIQVCQAALCNMKNQKLRERCTRDAICGKVSLGLAFACIAGTWQLRN